VVGVAVVAVVVAIVYFSQTHTKSGAALLILAVLAVIGASFSTAPRRSIE
jgi:nitrate/nitrite transporter NarK